MNAIFWFMYSLGVAVALFCVGAFATGNGSLTYALSGAACAINCISLWSMRPGDPAPFKWYRRWRERRREAFHGYSTPLKPTARPFDGMPMPKPPARTSGRVIACSTCVTLPLASYVDEEPPSGR